MATVGREALHHALATASRTGSKGKMSHGAFGNLELVIADGRVIARGTSMEASIEFSQHAGTLGQIKAIIPREALDVVRAFPNADITIDDERAALALSAQRMKLRIPKNTDMALYPMMGHKETIGRFTMAREDFQAMAKALSGFTEGAGGANLALTGVVMSGDGFFAAADGRIMSIFKHDMPQEIGDVVLMPNHVTTVASLSRAERDDIEIDVADDTVRFGTGNVFMVSRRVAVEKVLPVYQKVMAVNSDTMGCIVDTEELQGALGRLLPLMELFEAWVVFTRDELHIVSTQSYGKSRIAIPCTWDGISDVAIKANPAYLAKLADAVTDPQTRLGVVNPTAPLTVTGVDNDTWMGALALMRGQNMEIEEILADA
ncbi:MAG: hypothetical protein E6Q97_12270 [Desulfurellales bacterium]|nr:MAG: hypothetical protein E6Q97_12270 [Desulfurellales bacterium]